MFNWIRELRDALAKDPCPSCEVLKQALERANYEREVLINSIIRPHIPAELPKAASIPSIKPPSRFIPFSVKKQMLEAEDRERARALREHADAVKAAEAVTAKPISTPITEVDTSSQVEKLEQELGIK